ncbi:MAG: DnaJ domain-containing protein [Clostridiales bacterium]|nr:DnaJ domain-containing protein [Clostridiales bacterium]
MDRSPYEILGISENASEAQLREAYKALAKKYQDERYASGPLSDIAAQKMKELDEAYDAIIASRGAGGTYGSNYNQTYYTPSGSDFSDVRTTINSGRIDDAETILDGIPLADRNAEWHYLKALIQHRRGWFEQAAGNFSEACRLDPDNKEYAATYNDLVNKRNGGFKTSNKSDSGKLCDVCSGLICADCCCECMGGDLIPCC